MAPRKKPSKARKNNPKMDKLEAFLEDFDCEVKTVIERLKERRNHLLKDADNCYNMALIKLPTAVRRMNWLEYCNKLKSPVVEESKKEEAAATVESVLAEVHTLATKTVKKSSRKKGGMSSEDEENTVPSTVKKPRAKKPPTTSKKAKALSVSRQNTSVTRSSRKPLVTPARTMLDSSFMGPTPLVTPRFDPRLPKTPAVRNPRHKERLYSISVNGSPVSVGGDDIVINVPIGNGESIQLLASQMDTVDLSQLDETAIHSIRLLQNRLTSLCGPSV